MESAACYGNVQATLNDDATTKLPTLSTPNSASAQPIQAQRSIMGTDLWPPAGGLLLWADNVMTMGGVSLKQESD